MTAILARRTMLAGLAALAIPAPRTPAEAGQVRTALPSLSVWRDPYCGCCGAWVAHMRAAGFTVHDRIVASLAPIRQRLGTPSDLLSCHAAEIGGYALEGHVPALAVMRLLRERPAVLRGLAVPGMPIGSPGMESPGTPPERYDVIAFDAAGRHAVFMRFLGGDPA